MKRYATIEHNSGYVWWVGDAESPQEAVRKSDAVDASSAGQNRYTEVALGARRLFDTRGGFSVYEVPLNFDATAEEYDEVERYPRVAVFKADPIDEENEGNVD